MRDFGGDPLQVLLVFPGDLRLTRQHRNNSGGVLLEARDQCLPDPVSRNPDVQIGGVVPELEPVPLQVQPQVGTADLEQRPDHPPGSRADPAQTSRPGAAGEAQQERLRLIVQTMPHSDDVSLAPPGRLLQEPVTDHAGSILERAPLPQCGRHDILAPDLDCQIGGGRQSAAECLIRVSLGPPELMVQVSEPGDGQLAAVLEDTKDVQQRDRVGATRNRDEHASPGRQHAV